MKIHDFNNCPISDRNGFYGGQAGSKEGIVFNDEYWIIKYPKTTRGMRNVQISYTTSPISEYIGSHIYRIFGYDAHETLIGIRNNKLVVACKDFCESPGELLEYRTLRNIYNEKIEEHESKTGASSSHSQASIDEIMINMEHNPILKTIPEARSRFWDCAVVDVMINNNDRNNGNWGVLRKQGEYVLAPIYDNGASFSSKLSDEQITSILKNPTRLSQSIDTTRTAYIYQDKELFAKDLLALNIEDLKESVQKIVNLYSERKTEIESFIDDVPETYDSFVVCSAANKELIKQTTQLRMELLIEPTLHRDYENEVTEKDFRTQLKELQNEPRDTKTIKDEEYEY